VITAKTGGIIFPDAHIINPDSPHTKTIKTSKRFLNWMPSSGGGMHSTLPVLKGGYLWQDEGEGHADIMGVQEHTPEAEQAKPVLRV
jgi:hypothetical protein